MIIPRKLKSRFGTGVDAIRVDGLGSLVEVDADLEDNKRTAQISETDSA